MPIARPRLLFALSAVLALAAPATALPIPPAIELEVDARDIERHIQHVKLRVPVTPGPLTLVYPRWIPGHHAPTGPIHQIAGLQMRANGQPLRWQRDSVDMYAFHLDIPSGTQWLDVAFDYFSPTHRSQGRIATTPDMLAVQWHRVLMYPAGQAVASIPITPKLHLPAGWQAATALAVAVPEDSQNARQYAQTTVETLVDSPVYAGRHLRRYLLADGKQPVWLEVMADRSEQLDASMEVLAAHQALIVEADQVFGARPFTSYRFLLALSEQFSSIGLEHATSSENGLHGGYLQGAAPFIDNDLLAHEYVHAWNGKQKRPEPSWTTDYQTPMRNTLLWMYEGQTQFWAFVLAARSGLYRPEQAMAILARQEAEALTRSGRQWRNLADTQYQGIIEFSNAPLAYEDWQRSYDFYSEGALLWLAVDARLWALGVARGLDDFARAFFADTPTQGPTLRYGQADIITHLQALAPKEDWARFLEKRLEAHESSAIDGLTCSGWRLVFKDATNIAIADSEASAGIQDLS